MTTPNFILDIRKKIGHDPLWLMGVVGYVTNEEGKILLGRRADNGQWALISGIIEPGEQPADTLVREFSEETGMDVIPTAVVAIESEPNLGAFDNGDQVQFMNTLFFCELKPGGKATPTTPDGENTDSGWFDLDSLPQPMQPDTMARLKLYGKYLDARRHCEAHTLFHANGEWH